MNVQSEALSFRKLTISNSFLKDAKSQLSVLLAVMLLSIMLLWSLGKGSSYHHFVSQSSILSKAQNLFVGFFLPELCSLYILNLLIRGYIKVLNFKTILPNAISIIRYQLSFVPLFCIAFFVFFPFTVHLRFLLREFPNYEFARYAAYVQASAHWGTYWLYLPFVFILGYALVNIALIKDFLQISTFTEVPAAKAMRPTTSPVVAPQNAALLDTNTTNPYLEIIEGRNVHGAIALKVEKAFYFETNGEQYFVHHPKGRYRVVECLNDLEDTLDPLLFFRVNRQTIINLHYLKTYAYWEKGKYIVTIAAPSEITFTMTKMRYQALKEAMQLHVMGQY
jgi:two-component system, LytTR family, response regulator